MSILPLKIIHAPPARHLSPAKRLRLSPFDRVASVRRTPGQRAAAFSKQISMDSIATFPPMVPWQRSHCQLTVNPLLKLLHQLYPLKLENPKCQMFLKSWNTPTEGIQTWMKTHTRVAKRNKRLKR